MMKHRKVIVAILLSMLAWTLGLPTAVRADSNGALIFDSVMLSVGRNESERNLVWLSNCKANAEVRYAETIARLC